MLRRGVCLEKRVVGRVGRASGIVNRDGGDARVQEHEDGQNDNDRNRRAIVDGERLVCNIARLEAH